MNPRRCEDVLIAYFPKATDESQWPFSVLFTTFSTFAVSQIGPNITHRLITNI